MTRYLLYFLTGVAVATFILFFRGYGGVPHSVYSDAALVGAMALFGVASWLTLYKMRIGATVALLCLLAQVPWVLRLWQIIPHRDSSLTSYVLLVHGVLSGLVLCALVVSARYVLGRHSWAAGTPTPGFVLKIILTLLPLAVAAAWLYVMPKL
ncbi:hypothetical protein MKJ04_02785 [Pontibacter sp. E15-1]|uniref:hypothetical protein n=1 Tax=Pontibacter sp. E15-1 TaxID=2919918 RepID=UPI001F5006FB|nr:hypothetical protein [Pontibacter sp. E15-1]MCJ8163750.1 hypothetical protein [Pontibacter sp. E15-1]